MRLMLLREPVRTRLLFVSLAANLFLAGLLGAPLLWGPPHFHGGPEGGVERMAHDLPPPDAERFRAAMALHQPERDRARRSMDDARMSLANTIGSTPYDEVAVRQAMRSWQSAWMDWSDQLGASMLSALASLSPDGRARLAEAGRRPPPPPR